MARTKMGKKSWGSRILVLVLSLVCVVYIGYQAMDGVKSRIHTVEAAVVTVEDKVSCEGVFIREEQPIFGDSSKTVEYLVKNGEKVANGERVAMFFNDGASLTAYHEMRAVEHEIESLRYAYTHLSGGADGVKLDSLITISMLNITEMLEQGSVAALSGDYADLLQLVLRRDGDRITSEDYKAQLAGLESRKKSWQSQVGTGASSAAAPAAGYFVRAYDGLGKMLSPSALSALSIADIRQALSAQADSEKDVVGGLVQGFEWYFAAAVGQEQAAVLRERSAVLVRFPSVGSKPLRVSVYDVRTGSDGQALVIFRSGTMEEGYLTARAEEVDIIYNTYPGIKVPKEALRQEDGQWGVYCLVGGIARFKPVEWVYQTDSYYLVKPAESASKGLVMYDQIITGGKDLEKDKVVK